jgi:hypothetical protein
LERLIETTTALFCSKPKRVTPPEDEPVRPLSAIPLVESTVAAHRSHISLSLVGGSDCRQVSDGNLARGLRSARAWATPNLEPFRPHGLHFNRTFASQFESDLSAAVERHLGQG